MIGWRVCANMNVLGIWSTVTLPYSPLLTSSSSLLPPPLLPPPFPPSYSRPRVHTVVLDDAGCGNEWGSAHRECDQVYRGGGVTKESDHKGDVERHSVR